MVNRPATTHISISPWTARLVILYVAVVAGTIIALGVLSALAPAQATAEAWGHALIVSVFAVLLPLRLRAAKRGSSRAYAAVGIISTAMLIVNVAEALIPGLFPVWMRIEMVGIAALMAVIVVLVWRNRGNDHTA